MSYDIFNKPTDNAAVLELREPAVASYSYGKAAAEPWANAYDDCDDDFYPSPYDDEDYGPDGGPLIDHIDLILSDNPDPKYAEARAALERMFEEAEADKAAGRVYTTEEVLQNLKRKIQTGKWDD